MDDGNGNSTPNCPGDEVVLDYAGNRLTPENAATFEEHYFACDRCFREVETALEIRAAFAGQASDPGVRRPPSSSGWWALFAAAAAGLVAVGLWLGSPTDGDGTSLRGAEEALDVSVAVAEDGITATWPAVAGAEIYVVQLFTPDGIQLIAEETAETSIALDRARLASPDSESLLLRVQALDVLRQQLAVSRLEEVELQDAPDR